MFNSLSLTLHQKHTKHTKLDVCARSLQRSPLESARREEADRWDQLATQDGAVHHLEPCDHGETVARLHPSPFYSPTSKDKIKLY